MVLDHSAAAERSGSATTTATDPVLMVAGTTNHSGSRNEPQPSQAIPSQHADYIYDTALDVYGRRLATCSCDRVVRVWDLMTGDSSVEANDEKADANRNNGGLWSQTSSWQAHRGAVTSVAWAHPEFGSLLATCGTDHDAKIWEESSKQQQLRGGNGGASGTAATATGQWTLKASLTEARRGVTCCEFAPRHWGLKLVTGSADGSVRTYEAVDVMNLSQWPLAATLQPPFGSESSSADGSGSGSGAVTSVSWCTGRFDPPTLAVGGSHVVVYRYSDMERAWQMVWQSLPAVMDILDVAWAPNVGRRFHTLSACSDAGLHVFTFDRTKDATLTMLSQQDIATDAWRCQWNVTGTVLASSGEGSVVQLFKYIDGSYQIVSKVEGDLEAMATAASSKREIPGLMTNA